MKAKVFCDTNGNLFIDGDYVTTAEVLFLFKLGYQITQSK